MNLNSWADWALILSGFGAFLGGLGTGFLVVIRHVVDKKFDTDVKPVLENLTHAVKELKPNGGGSLKDTVNKIWDTVQDLTKTDGNHEARLDALEKE